MELTGLQRLYLKIIFGWLMFSSTLILLVSLKTPVFRAVMCMAYGMILLWIVLCGGLMWRFREPITTYVRSIRLDWRLKFVLFCTLLSMVEEAITTSMTNCAPLLGVPVSRAYITASTNYIDVIGLHSVVIFVSFFVGWAVILWRYDFSPFSVFVIFGMTGTLAEMGFGGPQHIAEYAMWTFVYGLMIWLPVRSLPRDRGARPVPWWAYPLAVVAPYPFLLLFPLAGIISHFYPNHPKLHYPPIHL